MNRKILALLVLSTGLSQGAFAVDLDQGVRDCLVQPPANPQAEVGLFYKLQARGAQSMTGVNRIYYGKALDQYGDLRLPTGKGPFPVVIVVHGGAWKAVVNSDYTAPIAELLTQKGYATWNIEYSRIGSGGEWPGSFKSVGEAADYLNTLAQKYPLDLNRVATIGHSSGGHYALWLGARHNINSSSEIYTPKPLAIKGVVSLDGTPDLAAFAALPRGKVVIPTLMGNPDPEKLAERYKDGSPVELLPLGIPQVFITQPSDRLPSIVDYIAKGKNLNDRISYKVLCPANHFTTADTENPEVRNDIIESIKSVLK